MRNPECPPNRIRQWRRRRQLTLDALAALVGSTNQTIGRYERGERSVTIDVLLQLAPALGCKPADLLPDSGSILSDEELLLMRLTSELDAGDVDTLLRIARALAAGSDNPSDDPPDDPSPRLRRNLR